MIPNNYLSDHRHLFTLKAHVPSIPLGSNTIPSTSYPECPFHAMPHPNSHNLTLSTGQPRTKSMKFPVFFKVVIH